MEAVLLLYTVAQTLVFLLGNLSEMFCEVFYE